MRFSKKVSHTEEIELCKQAQEGSKTAMDKMVTSNLGLVSSIAKKNYYQNDQYTFDDLFQEGIFGLIRAIEKFDAKAGCRFSTYSYYWIYAFISRFRTNNRGKIRIPSHIDEKLRKLQATDETSFNELKAKIPVVTSLNKIIGENTSLIDLISDDGEEVFENIDREIFMENVRNILSEKEFEIITHRFGLEGKMKKTHRECAKMFGVSHTSIYLTEKKACEKIRQRMS